MVYISIVEQNLMFLDAFDSWLTKIIAKAAESQSIANCFRAWQFATVPILGYWMRGYMPRPGSLFLPAMASCQC